MTTDTTPALEARGVVKRFADGTVALAGVDLAVARGETVALVGESGSGKTTLLRMFNRMATPSAGEVRIGGQPAAELPPVALRRQTGYVQQEGGLLPHWTVAANVALVPRLLDWPRERRAARTAEVLELVGLPAATYGARYPGQLSGGQRQRVAVARALAAEPPVVLLDEPFGALDALTRRALQDELAALTRRLAATAFLLVTHDLGEAFRLADRVAVLRAGRLVRIGTPAELAARPGDPYVAELLAAALPGSAPSVRPETEEPR